MRNEGDVVCLSGPLFREEKVCEIAVKEEEEEERRRLPDDREVKCGTYQRVALRPYLCDIRRSFEMF